jgi:hypothetical protein
MLRKFARLMEKIAGSILGSLAVSAPVGNMLICVAMIFFGPAAVLKLLGH